MTPSILSSPPTDSPEAAHQRWRQRREQELSAPESWLGLVGLHWLEPGVSRVGSAPDSAVVLPDGPARLGELCWQGDALAWRPAPGTAAVVEGGRACRDGTVALHTDREGEASRVRHGRLVFSVIERDGRLAVRVRDLDWRDRRLFAGVDCYPFDQAWRIEAAWEELGQPVALAVQSATGEIKSVSVRHRATFRAGGADCALLPLEVGEEGVFFIFRDASSGRETYGGGRFLKTKPPLEGRLILDFNRAFNPPCAFTPFATCTLAPPENRLSFAVAAGEKKYAGSY